MRDIKISIFLLILFFMAGQGLYADSLKLLYPNGGETLKAGNMVRVSWTAVPANNGQVVLVLYKKGIKHSVITKKAPNKGFYMWKVPRTMPVGKDYRIRIRLLKNLSVNDFSDRDFTIKSGK